MGSRFGVLGIWARWVVLGHGGLGLGICGLVWGLRGFVRVSFGLGWDGFWVEVWGFRGCGFGVWGGTGWFVAWCVGLLGSLGCVRA